MRSWRAVFASGPRWNARIFCVSQALNTCHLPGIYISKLRMIRSLYHTACIQSSWYGLNLEVWTNPEARQMPSDQRAGGCFVDFPTACSTLPNGNDQNKPDGRSQVTIRNQSPTMASGGKMPLLSVSLMTITVWQVVISNFWLYRIWSSWRERESSPWWGRRDEAKTMKQKSFHWNARMPLSRFWRGRRLWVAASAYTQRACLKSITLSMRQHGLRTVFAVLCSMCVLNV